MSLHRFYLPPTHCGGSELVLTDEEAHHALDVLRVKPGQRVAVLDGEGHVYHCDVQTADKRRVVLKVLQKHTVRPLPYQVTLLQAVLKGKAMDWLVQKATELGAHRLVPLLSERSTVHPEETAGAKTVKWQTKVIEAAKQCGSAWLTRVETPVTIPDYLAREERFDLSLITSLRPDRRHPREWFQAYSTDHGRPPERLSVWVGPEGDFTPAEIHAIQAAGARPISLGPLILRSETAAIYGLSVLNYELQAPRVEAAQP